ncbi:MAG: PorV/PorQ family protein [Calditrichaeota bacterium]|nr:PorV/PorQ family protein [Calditrichota bacterium]RQW07278.1 MAG: PorV/PorQ family protein [Calditrichota bacterium]
MIKYIIICSIILFVFLIINPVQAEDFDKAGTTGFVFLEIPVTARSMAMGEAGITLPDAQAEGLFLNPALVAYTQSKFSINLTYSEWYVETSHQALGLTYQIPGVGTLGLQFIYFDFGEIQKTRNLYPNRGEFGEYFDMGTYTAGAFATGLTYSRRLTDKFSFGTTFKYVRETIDIEHADNIIMDIGFYYNTGFRSLRIGAFLKDFGLEAKYVNEKFKMPQQLKFGLSYDLLGGLESPTHVTFLAEAIHPNDAAERVHFGMEAILMDLVIFRGGYKLGYDDENLSLGAGLRLNIMNKTAGIDVAYMNHDYLDTTLRYSFSIDF